MKISLRKALLVRISVLNLQIDHLLIPFTALAPLTLHNAHTSASAWKPMPRLCPRFLHLVAQESRYLPSLLIECRDYPSTRNDLRWLRQHVMHLHKSQEHVLKERLLAEFVRRRSRGETLQYIIGNQSFGDLEILCRVGVLIPRPETENLYPKPSQPFEAALTSRQMGTVQPQSS